MGKSFRKHDIIGHGGGSEKNDKRSANRNLRCKIKRLMRQDPFIEVFPIIREVSNVWCFNKDGKSSFRYLKNGNHTHYPHLPYYEDPYYIKLYRKLKSK